MNLETLCSVLIEDPLSKIQKPPENTVSIVIDALDDCELSARDEFVKVLLSKVRNMPSWVKFIVTTRSTKLLLAELPHVTVSNIEATERSNTEDIELFLVDQLQLLYSSSSKDQVQETARKIAAGPVAYSSMLILFFKQPKTDGYYFMNLAKSFHMELLPFMKNILSAQGLS